jgi:hypothetical protein
VCAIDFKDKTIAGFLNRLMSLVGDNRGLNCSSLDINQVTKANTVVEPISASKWLKKSNRQNLKLKRQTLHFLPIDYPQSVEITCTIMVPEQFLFYLFKNFDVKD